MERRSTELALQRRFNKLKLFLDQKIKIISEVTNFLKEEIRDIFIIGKFGKNPKIKIISDGLKLFQINV